MHRISVLSGVAGLAALLATGPLQAQYCAGYPTVGGQTSIGGIVGFPPGGGTSIGAEANMNFAGSHPETLNPM
jgi:hypothetical protein